MRNRARRRVRTALSPLALAGALLAAARGAEPPDPPPATPPYPRVALATWYEVDPSWPQKPARFPWGAMPGIAVDARDQVWIFTRAVPPVQAYAADGRFLRAWGQDQIKTAHHIRIDARGRVWVADIGHHVVMQFTSEGQLLRTLGTRDEPGADAAHLDRPTDMAITPAGEVFVSDGYGNNRVVHYDRDGRVVATWGRLGTAPGEFSLPHAIALDARGRLYVTDRDNVRVQVFDQRGRFLDQWAGLVVPWGLWVTPADEVWVCGSSPMPWRPGDRVLGVPPKDQVFLKFSPEGKLLQL
ncbi:MAG TPA: peptidyl-alpha-hydroxyglycine alpha-amidating lyase family protein [Isosphaeraceae bacterium]|jgi:hypothetical protein